MSLQCPRCHSPKVASFHHAMKAGAGIGTVSGFARGVSAALARVQAGAAIDALARPVGIERRPTGRVLREYPLLR